MIGRLFLFLAILALFCSVSDAAYFRKLRHSKAVNSPVSEPEYGGAAPEELRSKIANVDELVIEQEASTKETIRRLAEIAGEVAKRSRNVNDLRDVVVSLEEKNEKLQGRIEESKKMIAKHETVISDVRTAIESIKAIFDDTNKKIDGSL